MAKSLEQSCRELDDDIKAEILLMQIALRSSRHQPTAVYWKELIDIRTQQIRRERAIREANCRTKN